MGIFDRLFGGPADETKDLQPDIRFGRYSDSYKTDEQYDAWDRALELFEEERYLSSYRAFLHYLLDNRENNVQYSEDKGKLFFTIFQGSKKISGEADHQRLVAEAKIAVAPSFDPAFMRRLLKQNFGLRYSRFSLDDQNNIAIKFDSFSVDASPYKLYYALRELAISADKQDDLLLDEFRMLEAIDVDHLQELPREEKEIKYRYVQKEIKRVFDLIDSQHLSIDQYPGGIAYLLLHLSYKLDFLIKPEGFTMETLERIHRRYFTNDGKSTSEKIAMLRAELEKIRTRTAEEFYKEIYRVPATFGITNPVSHSRIVSFINGELGNMDWYQENDYPEVAFSVPTYIVGYCLFNYAPPSPVRELFYLYMRIVESTYFQELGFKPFYYDRSHHHFDQKKIARRLQMVNNRYQKKYPKLRINAAGLKYDSLPGFAKSYLLMIRDLNLSLH